MKPVLFRPVAEDDLEAAFYWYEGQRPGLGNEFLDSLNATVVRIQSFPEYCPVYKRDTRRAILQRFPYLLFYRNLDDAILVVACLHPKLDPKRWPK